MRALISRMEAKIDPTLTPPTSLPCRLEAVLPGGQRVVAARAVTPGNAQAPLAWDEVKAKFHRCADGVLSHATQDRVVDAVENIDALPSTRLLLKDLVPS